MLLSRLLAHTLTNGNVMAATAVLRTDRLVHSAGDLALLTLIAHASDVAQINAFAAGHSWWTDMPRPEIARSWSRAAPS
jgi:hypothetical protein